MATLSVEISQEQEGLLRKTLGRNPGWNKALVTRALLAYFFALNSTEQETLVKKHAIISK